MSYIIKHITKRDRINVCLVENHYVRGKGARQKRTHLGVLNNETNELLLSAKQPIIDGNLLKMLEEKGILYTGNTADKPGRKTNKDRDDKKYRINKNEIRSSKVDEVGRINTLQQLATSHKIKSTLIESFGEYTGNKILDLAIYQASESTPLYLAEEWFYECGIQEGMSASNISRFINDLGREVNQGHQFFTDWINACGKPKSIVHDTTSISSYSVNIDEAEWGYNRDKEKLPQINIGLVVDKESKLPLWYKVVPGSIPDVKTLSNTSKVIKCHGLENFTYSLDRGYYSKANVQDLINENINFTIGVPISNNQAKNIIQSNGHEFSDFNNSILIDKQRLRYISSPYIIDMSKEHEVTLKAHLFFNPDKQLKLMGEIEVGLLTLKKKSQEKIFLKKEDADEWIIDNSGKLKSYLNTVEKSDSWVVAVDGEKLQEMNTRCGVTMILTNEHERSPEDVLSDYRARDIAEKIFDITKNGICFNRLRTPSIEQANGRIFIAFIATILRVLVEEKLKQAKLLSEYTVDEALRLLKSVKRLTTSDGVEIDCEIPLKARRIISALEKV